LAEYFTALSMRRSMDVTDSNVARLASVADGPRGKVEVR
jgi:hypothetical protein